MARTQEETVKHVQDRQRTILERIYDALGQSLLAESPRMVSLNKAYDATVARLEALLGPDAICGSVDQDLWETYHNVFKSDHGFRPRSGTRKEVLAYLDGRRSLAA